MVGSANEATAIVGGRRCKCLIDTGAQITSISKTFYDSHLSEYELYDIGELLKIECANGQTVPYLGYIEVGISLPGSLPSTTEVYAPVLVVPDTPYNREVPLCVGTNVIHVCLSRGVEQCGRDFVGSDNVDPVWHFVYASI